MAPPAIWILFRRPFQALFALVSMVSKPHCELGFSAAQFAAALATLTNEMATFACTTWVVVVSNVKKTTLCIVPAESLMICEAVNGWSNTMSK